MKFDISDFCHTDRDVDIVDRRSRTDYLVYVGGSILLRDMIEHISSKSPSTILFSRPSTLQDKLVRYFHF